MIDIDRVDQIKFLVTFVEGVYVLKVSDIEIPSAVPDIFGFNSWEYFKKIFNCVTESCGFASNGSGIHFPHEAAELGEEQIGVIVYNPIHEIEFTEKAFHLLTKNYFNAILTLANKNNDKILTTLWGMQFSRYVNTSLV